MVGLGPNQEETVGLQRQDHFLNLEQRKDHEVSVHSTHTNTSHSRSGSHVSLEEETRNLQLEIDHLRRKLCRKKRNASPSSPDYRPRSRTPPSESFSYKEERNYRQRSRSAAHWSLGNDAMSKARCQISKSPFVRRIERAKLPRWFTQPTFTFYNGRTNPVEYVSHFN